MAISSVSPDATSYFCEGSSFENSFGSKGNSYTIEVSLPEAMGVYVGELQEKWQFPSDHLPIGIMFDHHCIVSWNVLDSNFMNWVTKKNSQGLSRSMLADEHVYIEDSGLTLRDQHVVDLILEMIEHPSSPKHVIALQECGTPFLTELKARLPSRFEMICHGEYATLLDRNVFEIVEAKMVKRVFSSDPRRDLQEVILRCRGTNESLRFINTHIPGDPLKPGRFEFAEYLKNTLDVAQPTVAMGDMNFDEVEMAEAIAQQPFSLHTPYCTNISIEFRSKAIDHFIVYRPRDYSDVKVSSADEILVDLQPIVDILCHEQKTS